MWRVAKTHLFDPSCGSPQEEDGKLQQGFPYGKFGSKHEGCPKTATVSSVSKRKIGRDTVYCNLGGQGSAREPAKRSLRALSGSDKSSSFFL